MIIKIALTGICVCILNLLLRQYNKSFVIFVEIIFVCIVISLVIDGAAKDIRGLMNLFSQSALNSKVIICLVKGALICILTKLACDISYESGNMLVGDIIELSGRIFLVIISLPFTESIVKTAISFAT